MSSPLFIPFYPADYLRDTRHLSAEEHGAYILLICAYWQTGKPLADDDERLARLASVSAERWVSVRRTLAPFFIVEAGEWQHKRIEAELAKAHDKIDKARRAGEASGKARAPKRTPVERPFNARSTDVAPEFELGANQPQPESENRNNLGQQSNPVAARGAEAGGADAPGCPKSNIIDLNRATTRKGSGRRVTVQGVTASARRIGLTEAEIRYAVDYIEAKGADVKAPGPYLVTLLSGPARWWLGANCIKPEHIDDARIAAALSGDDAALRDIEDAFRQRGLPPGQTEVGRAS